MKNNLFLIAFMVFSLVGCKDGAEQSNEQEFKDAHETPKPLDFDGKGEMTTFKVRGSEAGKAYTVKGKTDNEKYLFVIHEWWGLNDYVKREADSLYAELQGEVTVMALDLYDGKIATNPDDAQKFMDGVDNARVESIIKGAIQATGEFAEIATIGWCFGGGWSLKTSIMAKDKAAGCVIYYGMPVTTAAELAPLTADVLGIFAKQDKWITPKVAADFAALGKATGKNVEVQIFDADHAFANPSGDRYNDAAAQEANKLAREFLKIRLL